MSTDDIVGVVSRDVVDEAVVGLARVVLRPRGGNSGSTAGTTTDVVVEGQSPGMCADHSTETAEEASDDEERTTIREGRNFEEEYRLDAADAGAFLVELGEQLQDGETLTITDDEWELPFRFGEPVELEVDYDGTGEPELDIELELPGRTDEQAPDVQ